ncbi:hypothetical protein [Paractinoplanes durhamensis]|uniref:Uncharacterized protein n=1 Tax=Paractinoplanes durhamensis TaxID=113563 RepID=A0ABQ3YXN9_9ACTN|nr:hypothetical protein [Actinoplanes durhamensis]GIE02360.1 hypothetical protein Adu01nite_37100 [Actinoplanes durhamensis]
MPSEIDLLRSLDDEPPAPSTVNIDRAIQSGRRRNRRRGWGYAGVAALTVVAVAGVAVVNARTTKTPSNLAATKKPTATASAKPKAAYTIPGTAGWVAPVAAAPTSCTIAKLPVPSKEPMALVSGGDPTGAYHVGRTYPKGGGYQAVIWHGGTVTKVMLPGDLEESLRDVNSAGTAVGWSYTGGSEEETGSVPYAYVNGKVVKLPGVQRGGAEAINEAGAIVGDDESAPATDASSHAIFWPSATSKPVRLPVPAGVQASAAVDIDEDGTTVGNLDLKTPYVWFADGTHHDLALPTNKGKTAVAARVFSIRNGIAVGVADETDRNGGGAGKMWAVQWNVRTGETKVLGGFDMSPDAINAQGWMVGIDTKGYAILDTGGRTLQLPMLAKHDPGSLTNIPNAISDDGRTIVGQSDNANDVIQPVVWHCQ